MIIDIELIITKESLYSLAKKQDMNNRSNSSLNKLNKFAEVTGLHVNTHSSVNGP